MSDVTRKDHSSTSIEAAAAGAPPSGPSDGVMNRNHDGEPERPLVAGLIVGRLLGQGGSSVVWHVTDDVGQRFALKVSRTSNVTGPTSGSAALSVPDPSGRSPLGPVADSGALNAAVPSVLSPGRRGRRAADPRAGTAAGERPAPSSSWSRPASAPAASPVNGHGPPAPDRSDVAGGGAGLDEPTRELRLLQRFTHEHLLRVHRIILTSQGPGMLADLAAGGSLLGLVTSRGPLPIPEVVTALVPIAHALHYLHGAGALHGDVTPGNILFTHEGKPLLSDLGTSRLLGADDGAAAGTPGFIDPGRSRAFDAGTDVFALAAVSWFALTGRVPGPTDQRPPLLLIVPDVPAPLMHLIEDGLSPDRDRRPTAEQFARTLLASSAAGPVNLVPAVHSSVLPELLTRRAGPLPTEPRSRWQRMIRTRTKERRRAVPPSRGRPDRAGGLPRGFPRGNGAAGDSPTSERRRGDTRDETARGRLAVLAGLLAVVLLVTGLALTLGGLREPSAASDTSSADPGGYGSGSSDEPSVPRDDALLTGDPATALASLAAARARAFATADPTLLTTVDVEGSPAMSADRAAVQALSSSGRSLRDLTIAIRKPTVMTEAECAALPSLADLPAVDDAPPTTEVSVVRATAALSSYTETGAVPLSEGVPVPPLMAAGQQDLMFILWNSGDGWRIHSVVSLPA